MKLLLIFAAILAFSLAEENKEFLADSQAEASAAIELMKEGADLNTAASTYNTYVPPSQRPPLWNAPNYVQPSIPPQNSWLPPQGSVKPIQPIHTSVPGNVQNDYYDHQHHQQWVTPATHPPTTTPTVSVIKDERYYGENGHYKYEYQIADGTHVGEEGWYTDPRQTEESLVKVGWYSYRGADGKTYTVTYRADNTGYHAYGDHLPTPAPAIQAALDKEKEAEKYKPQYDYPTQTPAPVYYPTQAPAYVPPQQPALPPQVPTYQPIQQATYRPLQQATYRPPQQPTYTPQQNYYPSQQNYYPQQPANQI